MHWVDLLIFIVYMIAMLGVGYYFMQKNESDEDYYLGGRKMGSLHIGLSVVATDVGGGFSIGLGGLGFVMGLSGSWMLFTGLVGAWLSAVLLIPRVANLAKEHRFFTFPQLFKYLFNSNVAVVAAVISLIGYLGFTSSQLLAGAKLAAATFPDLNTKHALLLMGIVAVVYTVLGGLKAVIYTDTVQWAFLMFGLIFVGLPMAYFEVGGLAVMQEVLPEGHLSFANVEWNELVNWFVTIVPIWFVGMTLYQRIYAANGEKQAKRAWFFAGLLEWPIMALMGVMLGLFAKVAFEKGILTELSSFGQMDPEMGLPLLLKTILPAGLMGIMMAAYFSAILSTADSCLMAASGNLVTDLLDKFKEKIGLKEIRLSQLATLVLGFIALFIALNMKNVLDLMLYSYAFMVSGLLIPLIGGLFFKINAPNAAIAAMIVGGSTTVGLSWAIESLPYGLDANVFGISASLIIFVLMSYKQINQKYQLLKSTS